MPIGAIIGGIGAIVGGVAQSRAANKSAQAQQYATDRQIEVQREQLAFDRQQAAQAQANLERERQERAPWIESGRNALAGLNYEMGMGGRPANYAGFQATPGYQFRVDQGMDAINQTAAARGMRMGGNTLKALADYNQGQASQEYGNYYNRLAGLAGTGQTAMNQSAGLVQAQANVGAGTAARGYGYANAVGGALQNNANAQATSFQKNANAVNSGLNNLATVYGMYQGGMFGQPGRSNNFVSGWSA